jgi:hypothetical protein
MTFTVEKDDKTIGIHLLCDDNIYDEIEIIIGSAEVYIRQYDESKEEYDLIRFSPRMFGEMLVSMDKGPGTYADPDIENELNKFK